MALTHTTPPAADPNDLSAAPHQRIVQIALDQARAVAERVIEATRVSLQLRLDSARTPGEHHAMQEARQQLVRLAWVMAERYPDALRKALDQDTAQGDDKPARSLFTVHFDDLELMDETQVNDSVERARARQVLVSAVEEPLTVLDALVCGAQGLPRVQPERNPLRPDVFLQALQSTVSQMQVPPQVRHDWMEPMAKALGAELRSLYLVQIDQLRLDGVKPVGYAMLQATGELIYVAPADAGVSPGFAADNDLPASSGSADPLLTLDRLRRLLLGEFNEAAGPDHAPTPRSEGDEPFAEPFAYEFEFPATDLPRIDPPATDFAMTVPAAFEALQEMNQVGQMMERLGTTPRVPAASGADGPPAAAQRPPVQGLGQALSMEVVALMVDNIARNPRLLWPVQQFIRALEPALMQLALADPRFFSHKEHAARRLLQDITDRSLAFNSPEAPGFQSFMRSLMDIAGPLTTATIDSADDFGQVLQQLHAKWVEQDQALKQERLRAIAALQHAEQRHLLAAQISREIWLLPDIGKVPDAISRFLMGPWAQVMAEARLAVQPGKADPGRYQELVDALLWSVQPELTRAHTGKLGRLLPKLLTKLREGLASIDYPVDRTEAVFDLLMQLHQQAFQPGPRGAAPCPAPAATPATPGAEPPHPPSVDDDTPWVAPSEARESGYIDISQSPETEGGNAAEATPGDGAALPLAASTITVGSWVNLQVAGRWERTQLSWIGSHGNLFLFTSASGRTQSMTLRLLDRLLQQGAMQVLAQQAVVDNALDAVAQTAMQNSVENRQ